MDARCLFGHAAVVGRRRRQRPWLVRAWCGGLGRPRVRRCRALADSVDEAVRERGGGLFDRKRSAGGDASQLGAVDASLVGRGDLAGEDRPLRVGGDAGVDRFGEPGHRRFECGLERRRLRRRVGRAAAGAWLPARSFAGGPVGRRSVSGMSRAARQIARSRVRLASLSVGTAQAGAVSGVQLVAAARTAVPWRWMSSWRRSK